MKNQRTAKNKKRGSFSTIILVAVFFVGLSVLLYPTISDFHNSKRQSQAIVDYDKLVTELTPEDYSAYFDQANTYNEKLKNMSFPFLSHSNLAEEYHDTLDVNGNGMIGYISIEKIKVQLPIYHGTSDAVLNTAVGHVEGSTLPIGGESTHSVLSAHRGLPSAKLFTNLDKMEIGDVFTIRVLDQTFTYQVDQILIVLPKETGPLGIVSGEDHCTLVTCTPYGINTHRMLVRGTRIENIEQDTVIGVNTEAYQIDPLIVTPAVAAPILGMLLIVLLVRNRNIKTGKKKRKAAQTLPEDLQENTPVDEDVILLSDTEDSSE